jgi:hypothetical protein
VSFFLTDFHLVRKVKDVNENDRLSNITLRNKLKYRITISITVLHFIF